MSYFDKLNDAYEIILQGVTDNASTCHVQRNHTISALTKLSQIMYALCRTNESFQGGLPRARSKSIFDYNRALAQGYNEAEWHDNFNEFGEPKKRKEICCNSCGELFEETKEDIKSCNSECGCNFSSDSEEEEEDEDEDEKMVDNKLKKLEEKLFEKTFQNVNLKRKIEHLTKKIDFILSE